MATKTHTPRIHRGHFFLQPKRRSVRQKSGFKVKGGKTGSECFIHKTDQIKISGKELLISFNDPSIKLPYLFSEKISFYGVGLYIRSSNELLVTSTIQLTNKKNSTDTLSENKVSNVPKNSWTRIGLYLEVKPSRKSDIYEAEVKLNLLSKVPNSRHSIFQYAVQISKNLNTSPTCNHFKVCLHVVKCL